MKKAILYFPMMAKIIPKNNTINCVSITVNCPIADKKATPPDNKQKQTERINVFALILLSFTLLFFYKLDILCFPEHIFLDLEHDFSYYKRKRYLLGFHYNIPEIF